MISTPFSIPQEALSRCESEPIRYPGCIQPFGGLIVYSLKDFSVLQLSENIHEFIGQRADNVLGQPLVNLIGFSGKGQAADFKMPSFIPEMVEITIKNSDISMTAFLHQIQGVGVLELEKTELLHDSSESSIATILQVRRLISRFTKQTELEDFLSEAANVLREISGFERVCVYQFIENNHGYIAAESTNGEMEKFKGLRFPNFDIPNNSRSLYAQMKIGHVHDMNYTPVELLPKLNPETNVELDLLFCLSRSHSINCRNYYHNLKVRSSYTCSILVEDKLWGLFTFHHREPHHLSIYIRSSIELINQAICAGIIKRELLIEKENQLVSQRLCSDIVSTLIPVDNWPEVFFQEQSVSQILGLLNAKGLLYYNSTTKDIRFHGKGLDIIDLNSLCEWIEKNQSGEFFETTCISDFIEGYKDSSTVISGIFSIRLPVESTEYLIWILPQEYSEIKWSGIPTKHVIQAGSEYVLHPRTSFSAWIEERKNKSRNWTSIERATAQRFRDNILTIKMSYSEFTRKMMSKDIYLMSNAIRDCNQPILLINEEGFVSFSNNAFEESFGYKVEGLSDTELFSLLMNNEKMSEPISDSKLVYSLQKVSLKSKSGLSYECALNSSVINSSEGELIGKVVIITDLTKYQKLQEEQHALEAKMFEFQKLESLRVLAGGVAHDFNNLLVGILGSVGLVKMEVAASNPIMESLNVIETASERAADLTKQMLAYSGQGRFILKDVNLNILVNGMLELLKSSTRHKALVEFFPASWLPSIKVDDTQVHQVVLNLVVNAAEATKDRSFPKITLSTFTYRPKAKDLEGMVVSPTFDGPMPEFCCLSVSDNGCGMDAEVKARMFEPFFSTKSTGRGLGMAAIQGIIRSHNGFITVDSTVGVGTIIHVGFPALTDPELKSSETSEVKRVLIIDDEPFVHSVLNAVFRKMGIRHSNVERGEAGLERLKKRDESFDLVLLDMNMPGLSGAQTLEKITEIDPSIPVFLMSGFAQSDFAVLFKENNVIDFISKPFKADDLVRLIEGFFAKSQQP